MLDTIIARFDELNRMPRTLRGDEAREIVHLARLIGQCCAPPLIDDDPHDGSPPPPSVYYED